MTTEERSAETQIADTAPNAPEKPKRKRRGKKRAHFQIPKVMPVSVRALWRHASDAERDRAHRQCAIILEYWLGRTTKEEVMERLDLPALRVWQLSQQALAGMLAGLLVQPRSRGKPQMPKDPASDPKVLKKEIERLRLELETAHKLIEILKDLPSNRDRKLPKKMQTIVARKSTPTKGKASGGKRKKTPPPDGTPSGAGSAPSAEPEATG